MLSLCPLLSKPDKFFVHSRRRLQVRIAERQINQINIRVFFSKLLSEKKNASNLGTHGRQRPTRMTDDIFRL
jgi:hypothetical protein